MFGPFAHASRLSLRQVLRPSAPRIVPVASSFIRTTSTRYASTAAAVDRKDQYHSLLPHIPDVSPPPITRKTLPPSTTKSLPPAQNEDSGWCKIFHPQMQDLLEPPDPHKVSRESEKVWFDREKKSVPYLYEPLGPYAGRSVTTKSALGTNFATAYRRLQNIIKENNVRRELRLQLRHEKTGVKRRRLRSERWRRKFAHEVKTKVQLVQQIRARGA